MKNNRDNFDSDGNKSGRLYVAAKAMILVAALAILAISLYLKYSGNLHIRHDWHSGVCSVCGKVCEHPKYKEGKCTVCGEDEAVAITETIEDKEENDSGCSHLYFTNGICDSCGYECPHTEHNESGLCSLCGGDCQHRYHTTAGICKLCGAEAGHEYVQGRCSVCGLSYSPVKDFISMDYFAEPENPGTLETVSYQTKDYAGDGEQIERLVDVYLPAGYSEESRYDVLILLNGEEDTWLATPQKYYDRESDLVYDIATKNLLDNMASKEECRELIVVAPHYPMQSGITWYAGIPDDQKIQWSSELRYDLLPYVAEHYSTYASPAGKDIAEARNHFGACGCGYGADLILTCTMPDCLDLVSWYGAVAASTSDMKAVGDGLLSDPEKKDLAVNYLLMAAGEWDDAAAATHRIYSDALSYVNQTSSDNAAYITVTGAYHDGRSWTIGLYNCLRLFFGLE